MKKCPYCKAQFTPNPRVGERQITCGKPACKAALKSDNNRKWRQRKNIKQEKEKAMAAARNTLKKV